MNIGPFVTALSRAGRPDGQMTLGDFITALRAVEDKTLSVVFDFGYFHPTIFDSWRGVYADLALGYSPKGDAPTVSAVLQAAEAADGSEFTGYKGGEFWMDSDTPLWVANHCDAGHTAISGVEECGWQVVIHTRWMEA